MPWVLGSNLAILEDHLVPDIKTRAPTGKVGTQAL